MKAQVMGLLPLFRALARMHPDQRIAIVKYSRGGSALQAGASGYGTWEPDFEEGGGTNQYDNALAALRMALAQADNNCDGQDEVLRPRGIAWMQGEADADHSREAAVAYRHNLKRMMDLLRAALRADDLPVAIGQITDSGNDLDGLMMDHITIVRRAQQGYTEDDRCAALVTVTNELNYSDDDWHYDSQGYLRLGEAFAEALAALESVCAD
jgi:hypothetical protein